MFGDLIPVTTGASSQAVLCNAPGMFESTHRCRSATFSFSLTCIALSAAV